MPVFAWRPMLCSMEEWMEMSMTKNSLTFSEAFEQAQSAAASYDPISLNKDPALLQLRRNDYAYGYAAGLMAQRPQDEPTEWQPISTAPKDGTKILLGYFPEPAYEGASTMESWEVAFWHGTHQKWCGRELLNAEGYFSPTHWMPLTRPAVRTE